MREQIRLDSRWQTRNAAEGRVTVFVPAPWADKHVVLQPAQGQNWTGASLEGAPLQRNPAGEWNAASVQPGAWNSVTVADGTADGARLVASDQLHISALDASVASDRSLSVRVRLSDGARGPVIIVFTVSAHDGRQVGGTELLLSRKTREVSVEIPLPNIRAGHYRLKATVSDGDHVVDNARLDVKIP